MLLAVNISYVAYYLPGSWPSLTVSGLGLTWTEHAQKIFWPSGSSYYSALYVFRAIGTVTPGTLSLTAGQTVDSMSWSLIELDGVDTGGTNGANAIVQAVSDSFASSGTSTSVTLAGFASADNAAFGIFGTGNYNSFTPGSGLTELSDDSYEYSAMSVVFKSTSQTTLSVTHSAADQRAGLCLELNQA